MGAFQPSPSHGTRHNTIRLLVLGDAKVGKSDFCAAQCLGDFYESEIIYNFSDMVEIDGKIVRYILCDSVTQIVNNVLSRDFKNRLDYFEHGEEEKEEKTSDNANDDR